MENTFCQNCGNSLNDDDIFCSKCGKEIYHEEPICPQCGEKIIGNPIFCSKCGAQLKNEKKAEEKPAYELPMKYYKYIIHFDCYATAVISLLTLISVFAGYNNDVYRFYPDMKGIDVFFAIANIGLAIWYLKIRQDLADFKKGATDAYIKLEIAEIIFYLFNVIILACLEYGEIDVGILEVILLGFFTYLESIYFKKRKHLFIND